MTRWFGSGLVVIPNLVRDLGFEFWVLKPRPVGGVLYLTKIVNLRWDMAERRRELHFPIKGMGKRRDDKEI